MATSVGAPGGAPGGKIINGGFVEGVPNTFPVDPNSVTIGCDIIGGGETTLGKTSVGGAPGGGTMNGGLGITVLYVVGIGFGGAGRPPSIGDCP